MTVVTEENRMNNCRSSWAVSRSSARAPSSLGRMTAAKRAGVRSARWASSRTMAAWRMPLIGPSSVRIWARIVLRAVSSATSQA